MNDQHSRQESMSGKVPYHLIRVRRRSGSEWLAWMIWLMLLAVLFEYTLSSFAEYEPQAGVLAGALFVALLGAGVIVNFMRGVDTRSAYRYHSEWITNPNEASEYDQAEAERNDGNP